jgi:energy-coupling factor transport system permease protein
LFLSTTRIEEFAYAFTLLGLPYRIGFTITLAFRLVPLFLEAAFTVIQAQRCRGLDIHRGHLLQRLRHYVLVLIPVFMGALRRADQMAIALEVRGFNSGRPRTSYQRVPWRLGDTIAFFSVLGITIVYLSLWQAGYGRIRTGE